MVSRLFALLLTIVLAAASAGEVLGQHHVQFPDGDSFKTFGASEHLVIDGVIDHIGSCSEGTDDFLFPAADVYIVEQGTVTDGSALVDAIGVVHTIVAVSSGGFVSESLGFTEPAGSIAEGSYSIVIDECQSGTFQEGIDLLQEPAFEVVIGPTIPPVPASFIHIKQNAANQAVQWAGELALFSAWLTVEEVLGLLSDIRGLSNPASVLQGIFMYFFMDSVSSALDVGDPKEATIHLLTSMIAHYQAIADDPPDPQFEQLVLLGEREKLTALEQDPLSLAAVGVGRAASQEEALLQAFLQALERYQGAREAENATWALIHARALLEVGSRLADRLPRTSEALDALSTAVTDSAPLDDTASKLENLRSRVVSSGFTGEERERLAGWGLSPAEIDAFQTDLAEENFAFAEAEFLDQLAALQAAYDGLETDLTTFLADLGEVISTLEGEAADPVPIADPGGPYAGDEGASITIDGSASSTPGSSLTSYVWDLDGDGTFDDAAGPSVSHTYDQPFTGLIGLQVTNTEGFSDVSYAALTINEVNRPPVIDTFMPDPPSAELLVGDEQTFELAATDPEGDPLAITWRLDETDVGTGSSFTYSAGPADAGVHLLGALVEDGSPAAITTALRMERVTY